MKVLYSYFLFFHFVIIGNQEYIYPVAFLNDNATIFYMHQHTLDNVELYAWNTKTNKIEPCLWSIFNPANVLLLPNKTGFSFIDKGRLKIKSFEKRSPKAIDIDEPFFSIHTLHWIDEHTCYCSAKKNSNFDIFQLQDNGNIQCLMTKNNNDCMYPQKINNHLFFIMRYKEQNLLHYEIRNTLYKKNKGAAKSQLIIDFNETPIIFLTMISDKEGFVIEHPQNIDNNETILFTYYHIIKQNNDIWRKNKLFSFNIPTYLLVENENRLYESLLPLLPRIIYNKIYFVDCDHNYNNYLEAYTYNLHSKSREKVLLPEKKGHYFVPLLGGNNDLYYGGTPPLFVF